ncbi:ABC transporter substrate-binding protein [Lacihabitans sp. CS3-21]|uniref:ABC transporter substrate-binding protein n=1 Tax=Lacihabitans sp. CS3-21 TaxID=2487332 RepID=UPI0020CCD63C|nr:ABC transporter substrate-binding protein [Lacihabitans sp. CS3-21]MCP9746338.1 amino acid ABC transporter substrate-binding protein [Lacihabitans sp. CS3-21]
MKKVFVIVLGLFSSAFGQQLNDQAYLIEYKKAVQLFADSQYDLAGPKFAKLCEKEYANPMVPYAYFYNALTAKNKGNLYQSRVVFRQLFEKYFDWDKIDEARIIYAELNFGENYFEEGLKSIEAIQDKEFDGIKKGILNQYIPKIKSISTLKELYFKFPTQEVLARNLVEKIQANRYNSKDDLEISDMLTNRFKLKEIPKNIDAKNNSSKEFSNEETARLDFGILLPFNLNDLTNSVGSNKYTYELYEGMKIAAEQLKNNGIIVNLHAFDVKKTKEEFQALEKKEGFKNLDLFVGPLYSDPNNEAVSFALTNKIIQVHPLSNNLELLKDGNSIFLMQPSHLQQSKKTIEYVSGLNKKKSVSIYFGNAKKDSLFATIYRSEALKKGYTITTFRKFNGMLQKLLPEVGHIFLATDNNHGIRFLQSVSLSKITTEVICTPSSFAWEKTPASSLTENVSLIYPEFVSKEKEQVRNFEKLFLEKMATQPSFYAFAGYDLVYFFGKMLKDGKDIFKLNIESGAYEDDYLLGGFDFSGKIKENAIVPIVKYKNDVFEEIYR